MEEGGSDWLNSVFTFLYGLINPLEYLEEENRGASGVARPTEEEDDDDDEDNDEDGARTTGRKDDSDRGQKIVIVGLQNQ